MPALDRLMVNIIEYNSELFKVAIHNGHPDECIAAARRLFHAHFTGSWHITSIEAKSPYQRGLKQDRLWQFTIEARLK